MCQKCIAWGVRTWYMWRAAITQLPLHCLWYMFWKMIGPSFDKTDSIPHHDFGPPHESLSMRHVTVLNISSPDTVAVICDGNTTSTFIWYAIHSLLVIPVWTWHSPLHTLRTMTNCKKGFSRRTMTSCVVGDQSTSDNVISNWSLVVANFLSWCVRVSSKLIIHMFSMNLRAAETLGRKTTLSHWHCLLVIYFL